MKKPKNLTESIDKFRYTPEDDGFNRDSLGAKLENRIWLKEQVEMIVSRYNVQTDSQKAPVLVPRFGALTHIAKTTNFITVDVPDFKKMIKTAATDGINVFFNQDFLEHLRKLEHHPSSTGADGIFVCLHELSHMLNRSLERMKDLPPSIANEAQDRWINASLIKFFPHFEPSPSIKKNLFGSSREDLIYLEMNCESIADLILRDENRKKKSNEKSQGGGNGGGGGGSGDGSYNEDSPSFGSGFDEGESHTIRPEDVQKIFKENGLDDLNEAYGYPSEDPLSEDGKKAFKELNKDVERLIDNAIIKSAEEKERLGSEFKYPGGHMTDYLTTQIRLKSKVKMDFRTIADDIIYGPGKKTKHMADLYGKLYSVEELGALLTGNQDLSEGIWLGSGIEYLKEGCSILIMDSSLSVSDEELIDGATMCVNMVLSSGNNDDHFKIYMASADTVFRGEILEINEGNVDLIKNKGVEIFGRGGTDFEAPLIDIMKHKDIVGKKIQSITYITDLGAPAPNFERLRQNNVLNEDIKIFFVATKSAPQSLIEQFKKDVLGYATVVPLRNGQTLDLTEEANTKKNNKRNKMTP